MNSRLVSIARLISFLLLLLGSLSSNAQTYYALQIDRNIRFKAADITAQYQPRLVMGADQALAFQETVARFLVKKKAVEEDATLSPKAKYEWLKRLSSRETSEMADVLESYRWQEYMRIKPEIQPIPKPEKAAGFQDAIVILDTTNQ